MRNDTSSCCCCFMYYTAPAVKYHNRTKAHQINPILQPFTSHRLVFKCNFAINSNLQSGRLEIYQQLGIRRYLVHAQVEHTKRCRASATNPIHGILENYTRHRAARPRTISSPVDYSAPHTDDSTSSPAPASSYMQLSVIPLHATYRVDINPMPLW